jgi:hypothetical protein
MRDPGGELMRFTAIPSVHHTIAAVALLLLTGCSLPLSNKSPGDSGRGHLEDGRLSAESRYAGEVLAYMMRVVLGRAGDLARRQEWRRQGLGQPLDLARITAAMHHPERPKSDLMVVDASLVGLSEVLYDYNPRLNLFKGRYAFHSPYPSVELIALRLLLLGKLDRGETLKLSAIVRHEAALVAQGGGLPANRLAEMGLTAAEADLLQAVFRSEPAFRWYYKSPALVTAMSAMGLLVSEDFVARRQAAYDYAAWQKPVLGDDSAVRVAVLPSLVTGFRMGADGELAPPDDYVHTVKGLAAALEGAVAAKLGRAEPVRQLDIRLYQGRPFVLHPLNIGQRLARLSPEADLVIIVLGRNVYRSMAFAPSPALGPRPPCWYLDILDLKYGQTTAEIEAIADAVVRRLNALSPSH